MIPFQSIGVYYANFATQIVTRLSVYNYDILYMYDE